MTRNSRDRLNFWGGIISATCALLSLLLGILEGETWKKVGPFALGAWTLLPPIFFWVDWTFFCDDLDKDELAAVKHTHDLARNIWLALIGVLVVLLKFQGGIDIWK